MKIAVIIPANLSLLWHSKVLDELRRQHAVDLYNFETNLYAPSIGAMLSVERGIYRCERESNLSRPIQGGRVEKIGEIAGSYDVVLDVTFSGKLRAGANTLRPYLGAGVSLNDLARLLMDRQNPQIAMCFGVEQRVLSRSRTAIEDFDVLSRALDFVLVRLRALIWRALEVVRENDGKSGRQFAGDMFIQPGQSSGKLSYFAGNILKKAVRRLRAGAIRRGHWTIALRWRDAGREMKYDMLRGPNGFLPIKSSFDAYYADPFIFSRDGKTYLFAEKFPYDTGKGVIVCAPVVAGAHDVEFGSAVEEAWHLSYPFVFEYDGHVYMMPESSAAKALTIYEAVDFPYKWVKAATIMTDIMISDATLFQYEGRWWIFGAVAVPGGSTQDELCAFHADDPFGPWRPHALNPIISDASHARPAGRVFTAAGGRLIRPAQDCTRSYGRRLVWCEITHLTPDAYSEDILGHWAGPDFGDFSGVHTYNRCEGLEAVDLKIDGLRRSACV